MVLVVFKKITVSINVPAGRTLPPDPLAEEGLFKFQRQLSSWYYVGKAYQDGKGVARDCVQAMKCYELGLQDPSALALSGSITPSSPS